MATIHTYRWQAGRDTIWHVAGRYLDDSAYLDIPTFVAAIQVNNPKIYDWMAVDDGAVIVIPWSTT